LVWIAGEHGADAAFAHHERAPAFAARGGAAALRRVAVVALATESIRAMDWHLLVRVTIAG
jgi:hypothetical protein